MTLDHSHSTVQGTSTSLYVVSLEGNLKVAKYLLDHGADVNQPTDVSNFDLHSNYYLQWPTSAIQIQP